MEIILKLGSVFGLKPLVRKVLNAYRKLCSRSKWRKLRSCDRIFLELGSGPKKGTDGWITIDLGGADIFHDLREGIPLPDRSVDRIYTSHMLEHIPYKSMVLFVNECHRVLKIGGSFSVCVPNARLYILAYINKVKFAREGNPYEPAIINTGSYLDQLNYIAYMDGQHHYMFDEENLVKTIGMAPFSKVDLREFDPDIDCQTRAYESIYAVAVR